MQVFFIEQNCMYNIFKSIFKRIELQGDKININCKMDKINKKIKIVKEIVNILKKNNSNKVILTKNLKQDRNFVNLLYSNQINIIMANKLFKVLIQKILENIIIQNKIKSNESEIAIAINDKSEWGLNLIKNLASEFKSIKIVTNNTTYFKKIEEDLLEKAGIIVATTDNKRKALLKSNIILNVDFPEELINKYSIYDKSIIINLEEKIKINKKRFCGKIINDFNIKLKEGSNIFLDLEKEMYKEFDLKDIVECYIMNKPEEIHNIIVY